MDTLALLCNLHGDGPETLQRLRSAGWDTLREIEEVELLALARALGDDNDRDRALRFQREAGFLRERLGEDVGQESSPSHEDFTEKESVGSGAALLPEAETPRAPEPKRRTLETPLSNRILEKTLATSGASVTKSSSANSDHRRPFAAGRLSGNSGIARPASSGGELEEANGSSLPHENANGTSKRSGAQGACELELPAREVFIPRPSSVNTQPPKPPISPAALNPKWEQAAENRVARIEPGTIDGLDAATSDQLAKVEIRSLTELSQAETLDLSERSGMDYTGLLRLQFLARRELAANPVVEPRSPQVEPEASPFDGASDDGVAGPFA
ncbi:MAG: hypothetical protein ACI8TQ_002404 [Planctomycetota bacterium]|jgi:hypothetical protein